MVTLYTVGHSTRSFDDFVEVLRSHEIHTLVDIRSYPGSRRLPQFNRGNLEDELSTREIVYRWEPRLGGRRKKTLAESPHTAIRSESFRNYADHTLTSEFREALDEILGLAAQNRTTVMCAEKMYFQCHRMIVSDYVVAHGGTVLHIVDRGRILEHKLTREAQVVNGEMIYSGGQLF